jgi:hypothetical protein
LPLLGLSLIPPELEAGALEAPGRAQPGRLASPAYLLLGGKPLEVARAEAGDAGELGGSREGAFLHPHQSLLSARQIRIAMNRAKQLAATPIAPCATNFCIIGIWSIAAHSMITS